MAASAWRLDQSERIPCLLTDIPKSYTDSLQLGGLRGARIGLLTNLLGTDPADAEIATVVRGAVNRVKAQDAEIVEVTIPGLNEVMLDRLDGFLILSAGLQV